MPGQPRRATAARAAPPPGPYLVAGAGRAGEAAARALAARAEPGAIAVWSDVDWPPAPAVAQRLLELGATLLAGDEGLALLDGATPPRTLIKSPGLPMAAPLVQQSLARGLEVLDEAELGYRLDTRPIVAITGTNGKSTTAALTAAVLGANGQSCVVAGNSTFGPPLCALAGHDADVVVAELSSFQLEGCTTLRPAAALLTNLTDEHVVHHGSAAAYAAAKRSLFVRDGTRVDAAAVGIDQDFGRALAAELRAAGARVVTFGRHHEADRRLLAASWTLRASQLTVAEGPGTRTLISRLVGEHNALNAVGALALADVLGIDVAIAAAAIAAAAPLPGRFEAISSDRGFDVVVDYAHNPDGLRQALASARAVSDTSGGALRVVCSALGFHGADQARAMGAIAAERADHLVLTTQRWRVDEPFGELRPGLLAGAQSVRGAVPEVRGDRADAIGAALRAACPGDVVMVLERGALTGPLYDADDRAVPFDDRAVVRALLAEIAAEG